jgi:DNA polymerase-3 subunit delta
MPAVTLDQFIADLKKGKVGPAYLFLGNDQYLLDAARKAIRQAVFGLPSAAEQPFGWKAFDLGGMGMEEGVTALEHALAQARTPSLLAPRQLIFLAGMARIFKRMRGAGEEEEGPESENLRPGSRARETGSMSGRILALVEDYLADPSDFTTVVFEASEIDKRKRLAKLLEKRCVVVGVEPPARSDRKGAFEHEMRMAAARARKFARARNIEIAPEVLDHLVGMKDGDLGLVFQELEKLAAYVGPGGKIGHEQIRLLVRGSTEEIVWELVDALGSGDRPGSMSILDNLIRNGEPPPAIVGALAYRIRAMIEAKEGSQRWPSLRAADQAQHFSRKQLLASLEILLRADAMLKGELPKAEDGQKVLEFLVARLTAKTKRMAPTAEIGSESSA